MLKFNEKKKHAKIPKNRELSPATPQKNCPSSWRRAGCSASVGVVDCDEKTPLLSIIPDCSLTADSTYADNPFHAPQRSRLHLRQEAGVGYGGWASANKASAWIQVDLLQVFLVSEVATQGKDHTGITQWVTEYTLSYGITEASMLPVLDGCGNTMSFTGNTDQHTVVRHEFGPVRARFVRLNVVEFHHHPAMRWEVYGCVES